MHHDPKSLRLIVEAAASQVEALTFKPMFGGIMGYAEGKPFASLSNVGIALKLDEASCHELLKVDGAVPLRYEPDSPPSKTSVIVPEAMHGDMDALSLWLVRSTAFVLNTAVKPRPKQAVSKPRPSA